MIIHSVHIEGGQPDSMNQSYLQRPGELGGVIIRDSKQYQIAKLDTGATSSTGTGVVAANQVAFWKDRATKLVTNDLRFSGRDQVAGIFRAAITAGYYCAVLQKVNAINVKAASATYTAGQKLVANSGTSADAVAVAAGTADTYRRVGVVRTGVTGTTVVTDVDVPAIE